MPHSLPLPFLQVWGADLDDAENTILNLMHSQEDPGAWPSMTSPSVSWALVRVAWVGRVM